MVRTLLQKLCVVLGGQQNTAELLGINQAKVSRLVSGNSQISDVDASKILALTDARGIDLCEPDCIIEGINNAIEDDSRDDERFETGLAQLGFRPDDQLGAGPEIIGSAF
jgi:predicted transcriptional regulator